MALKIRLSRHGRKGIAYYHIVVADSRSPRDGRFIERIGTYNPNTNPATIEIEFDKALSWMQKGALPTDTCKRILSYKGILMKKHLLEGVTKGAFDSSEAEIRFAKWLNEKEAKVTAKVDRLTSERNKSDKDKMAAETKVKEERSQALARKYAEEAAKAKHSEEVEQTEAPAEEEAPAQETE